MDLEQMRIGKVKKENLEITYSAEYGSEIRASLTYRTLGGTWIKTIKYYNRAECLMDYARLINDKWLIGKVESCKQYRAWLENY